MDLRINKVIEIYNNTYGYKIFHIHNIDVSRYQNTLKISFVVGIQGWKRIIVVVVTIITIFEAPDYRYD